MRLLTLALAALFVGNLPAACLAQSVSPKAMQPAAPPNAYIRTGKMFDSKTGTYTDGAVLVIAGERIQSVEPAGFAIPAGARTVDLRGSYVFPGLIDCHVHLMHRADQYEEIKYFKETPFTDAINGVVNAKRTLDAGFTTVRDVSSPPFAAVDLRDSIRSGFIPGPRIVASGPGISITGGHGDLNDFSPEVRPMLYPADRNFQIADGVDQVQQTVRAQVKYGVDVIKIMASGGVLSKGDQPGAPQYTLAELTMAADTAHQAGRKIAAHAHGALSIKWAIEAGIDSVEHASLADDEDIRLAKEHGTFFVMDIYDDDYILNEAPKVGLPQEQIVKERSVGQAQRDTFRRAWKAGVKMAFGTDAGVYPHGDNAKQFHYMVQYGMTPAEAVQAATVHAAELLGRSADVGELTPGHYADIIAVASDPLEHVEALEHVAFVMKGGVVDKDERAR
ncbi:amidohydrolase family protein [Acidipila sp. EB88]|uniref:Xaa-Pro dipeptidase n=1 Tax=Acidipila sp. EB88 TaxID=2305226 RepID=UPI000F5EF651|nr:amidohydrolase family protein [Acidipila sp. EB88]RRA49094.1 amidohydrolase family protein [Acidipila sp. EB88]